MLRCSRTESNSIESNYVRSGTVAVIYRQTKLKTWPLINSDFNFYLTMILAIRTTTSARPVLSYDYTALLVIRQAYSFRAS